jgi:transcription termination factor Rho
MNKAELESKPLSELHSLAAEAGVERYRMLARGELVAKLSGDDSGAQPKSQSRQRSGSGQRSERSGSRERSGSEQRQRPPRQRRRRSGPKADESGEAPAREREPKPEPAREPAPAPAAAAPAESSSRPKRRRRRRFGRRGKQELTLQSLLLPPEAGRQALLAAETREGCTALLRGLASDLAADSKGPDPVVLLIDPSPEELADWKREAPQAEIVAAGQARHASDALAQATARAGKGEDVMLLVDSLTRLGEAYEDASSAKEFFDAGRAQGASGGGTLTVVAALERS